MLSDLIFTLGSYGYKIVIEPVDIVTQTLGLSLHNDGYVNRTLITKTRDSDSTEEFIEWELSRLERSFDALAVKEDVNESPD